MRTLRVVLPVMLAAGLLPLAAAPASGAPPGNDEPDGAIALHLGDRVVQDTSEATTNANDDTLNAHCGAPKTNASVWYKFTPHRGHEVVLDMTASSYSGGFLVFKGTPTTGSLVRCGPDTLGLRAHAGTTYTIMVISDTKANGGKLVLTLKKAPRPRVHVSLARRGLAFRDGAARIHGTYYCKHAPSARLSAHLFQRAGRLKIQAGSHHRIRCNGTRHRWSAPLVSPIATYARGDAQAKVRILACGTFVCRQDSTRRHIHLAWASTSHRQPLAQPSTARLERPYPLVGRQRTWPGS